MCAFFGWILKMAFYIAILPAMDVFWKHTPSPGVLTVLLAVVAAAMTVPPLNKWIDNYAWLRNIFVAFIILLGAGEIFIIHHADEVSEERITKLNGQVTTAVNNTTEIQKDLRGFIHTQQMIEEVRVAKLVRHQGWDKLLILKGRAASLASDIFDLLLRRSEMFTGNLMFSKTPPSNPQESLAIESPYDEQTVLIFQQQKLGSRAIEITKELESIGLKDDLLRTTVEQPHNMIAVRIIANHLAALADQITPEGALQGR